MNPLEQYPSVRRALYTVQWIANGIATVLGAFFIANGTDADALPRWYVVGLAVLPVLWTYLGLTAAANTPAPKQDQVGTTNTLFVAVVVIVGLLVLLLLAGRI